MASAAPSPHAQPASELDNRRTIAAAIDMAAPVCAVAALFGAGLLTPATFAVALGWTVFYFFALESGGGQTIGKRAMKLRVVDADGREPSMRAAALRNVVRIADLPLIGLVAMMASGESRQRLGDRVAETYVVAADSPVSASALETLAPGHVPAEPAAPTPQKAAKKPKRKSLGGPEIKLPKFSRKAKPAKAKPAPAPVAAAVPSAPAAATAVAPNAKPSKKAGRKTLGGPEIKLPKLGRKAKPAKAKPAAAPDAAAAPAAKPAKAAKKPGRKTLGGPEIKLPKLGRKRKPAGAPPQPEPVATWPQSDPEPSVPATPAAEPSAAQPTPEVVSPEPTVAPASAIEAAPAPTPIPRPGPAPEPTLPPAAHEPEIRIGSEPTPPVTNPLGDSDSDEPRIEIGHEPEITIGHEPEVSFGHAPEPEPDISFGQAPEISLGHEPEITFGHDPEPAAAAEPAPDPVLEPRGVEPDITIDSGAQSPPPAAPLDEALGTASDDEPQIDVKPIETVSAIDLVMQDADEGHRPGS